MNNLIVSVIVIVCLAVFGSHTKTTMTPPPVVTVSMTTIEQCGTVNKVSVLERTSLQLKFNRFRSALRSSAMHSVRWSDSLAQYAQGDADRCVAAYKYADSCDVTRDHFEITSIFSHEVSSDGAYANVTLSEFLNELTNEVTGKYNDIITYDTLSEFGCALKRCQSYDDKMGTSISNAVSKICYFSYNAEAEHVPASVRVPYSRSGDVCSKCDTLLSTDHVCYSGLCKQL